MYLYHSAWKQFPISNISTIVESTMKYIDYNDGCINLTISMMMTGAFSQSVSKLFSDFMSVTDNLLFIISYYILFCLQMDWHSAGALLTAHLVTLLAWNQLQNSSRNGSASAYTSHHIALQHGYSCIYTRFIWLL